MTFENGKLVTEAYVEIEGKRYPVVMPVYSGNTPLNAANLNSMQRELKELFGVNKISVTDCNNAEKFGVYMIAPNCNNCPAEVDTSATQLDGNICYLIVIGIENIEPIIQFFIDSKNHTIYMRKSEGYYAGFEVNWFKIAEIETIIA